MPSEGVKQFLEQGQRCGLLAGAAAQEAVAQLTADVLVTVDDLAAGLMAKKVLTRYQADQLLAGRGSDCLVAGRYQILDKVGEGGMGVVYKACDTKLDRLVALKVMPAGRLHQADAVARFQREAKALARLSHPHIIQAYDSGEDACRSFLVMEYVEGLTLDQVLRRYGALPPTLAADLIHQAALGLQHAHEKGLIHRDLKPGNLLVTGFASRSPTAFPPEGEQEAAGVSVGPTVDYPGLAESGRWKAGQVLVKILDLGLARFLQDLVGGSQLTQEGMGVGTPDYMAPEQFRDALHADPRTDIYGLGCTLYHLIAGQVPFPGTSFSEKAQAHAKKQPIPLEERCPDVPGGLAFVAAKMMAKHPTERFQTAQAAADALVPYVAGGSYSMIRLRQTGLWHGAQPTMRQRWRGRRAATWLGGGAAAAILLALLVVFVPGFFNPPESDNPGGNPPNGKPVEPPQPQIPAEKPKKEPVAPAEPQIETIENGWTVAQDGRGQCKTIGEALEKVKPGQTIRVLDAAVYPEMIRLAQASRFANITIESPGAATLSFPENNMIVAIMDVPGVTIRGFRIRSPSLKIASVGVVGKCSGTTLQQLDIAAGFGIVLWGIAVRDEEPPVLVQDCTLKIHGDQGIRVSGILDDGKSPRLCRRVVLRGNRIQGAQNSLIIHGVAQQVQIVGNRISGAEFTGIALLNLIPGTKDILIANNTCWENHHAFTLLHDTKKPLPSEGIQVKNNLVVKARNRDFVFLDGLVLDGLDVNKTGEGEGASLLGLWQFGHNWREGEAPGPKDELRRAWIPPNSKNKDVLQERIPLVSTDPQDRDFLRPAKNPRLAKEGAGGDLPRYVGAVPPTGVEPWNRQWTWDAVVEKRLTVSKDLETGGRFRTIGAALEKVKPGQTIRVLDDAVYPEALKILRPATQSGIVLEAVNGATIAFPKGNLGISISNVPRLTIRGFRLRHEGEISFLIAASGRSHGLRLERLDMKATSPEVTSVSLEGIDPDGDLSVVENCFVQGGNVALRVSGFSDYTVPNPCGNLALRNNIILESVLGILLTGSVKQTHVTGNRIALTGIAGIQLENLLAGTKDILIANNTVLKGSAGLRLWDNAAKKSWGENIHISNNLIVSDNPGRDMLFLDSGGDPQKLRGPGDGILLLKAWQLHKNWRQTQKPKETDFLAKGWIPIGPTDEQIAADDKQDRIELLSRDPQQTDFLRPAKDSPLGSGGAGGDLPSYVGAIPPEGVPAWNWEKTWQARLEKSKGK